MGTLGQVFTPVRIARRILDEVGYAGTDILERRILEPSFGEGVFLKEIINRIYLQSIKASKSHTQTAQLIDELVWGVELDGELYAQSRVDLIAQTKSLGLDCSFPHLHHGNALEFSTSDRFGWVVGNPPYVRIHSISADMRKQMEEFESFGGVSDLYLIFFEVGSRLLLPDGKLGFITPNSFLRTSTQKRFRHYLLDSGLSRIIDFGADKVFHSISTYTAITILNKGKQQSGFTYVKDSSTESYSTQVSKEGALRDTSWVYLNEEDTAFLKECRTSSILLSSLVKAAYGVCTLRDKIFLGGTADLEDEGLLRPVVKGSRYRGGEIAEKIVFPYLVKDDALVRLNEKEFKLKYPNTYAYLLSHKEELDKRDRDKGASWFEYGRSQGLRHVLSPYKAIVATIVSQTQEKVRVFQVPQETVEYVGVVLTAESQEDLDTAIAQVESKRFLKYVRLVGKDMSGGWKSFTGKQMMEYSFSQK